MTYPLINDQKIDKNRACEFCGKEFGPRQDQQKYCCPEHQVFASSIRNQNSINFKQNQKAYREKMRKEAFALFGSRCKGCGESNPVVLCIDHIEPVGKNRTKITMQIYREILNDPEHAKKKYQLLCHNCNWIKMMDNNEHATAGRVFACQDDMDALSAKVQQLDDKINGKPYSRLIITEEWTEQHIEEILQPNIIALKSVKGRLDVVAMRLFLREKGIEISFWKAYNIKRIMELKYPHLFEH
jgi:hypothetical protein